MLLARFARFLWKSARFAYTILRSFKRLTIMRLKSTQKLHIRCFFSAAQEPARATRFSTSYILYRIEIYILRIFQNLFIEAQIWNLENIFFALPLIFLIKYFNPISPGRTYGFPNDKCGRKKMGWRPGFWDFDYNSVKHVSEKIVAFPWSGEKLCRIVGAR